MQKEGRTDMTFRRVMLVMIVMLLVQAHIPVLSASQAQKIPSEAIMDATLDMRRAAEQADKLAPLGAKYCGWGIASEDASDLDIAISRYLLNHSSTIPENIAASKMWRVSGVVGDLSNHLALGLAECGLAIRYSDDARTVADSAWSILEKMMLARSKFDGLAYQQTQWQEENSFPRTGKIDRREFYKGYSAGATKAESNKVLSATKELKESANAAANITAKAANTKGCLQTKSLRSSPSLPYLSKLLDYMEHAPRLPDYIPAANIWGANEEVITAQFDILLTVEMCSPYAREKKRAQNVSSEALDAYHRVTAAIFAFDALALQQTEWEEDNSKDQESIQEQ
jgi:hypothetical protein